MPGYKDGIDDIDIKVDYFSASMEVSVKSSHRSRRNRCVQLCLRTSVPGVDAPVQILESVLSHSRNNPYRNLPSSCYRWQNQSRNSLERHRAF